MTRGSGKFSKTITGLAEQASFDIKITFSDPDGVSGTNPLYKYNIQTSGCGDLYPPIQSNWNPAKDTYITTTSPLISLNTNENAWCRWSLSDQSYDDMSSDCSGGGTTTHSCAASSLPEASTYVYIACKDESENKDSASSNDDIRYNVNPGEIVKSGWNPAKGSMLTTNSPEISFTTSVNANCRWSTSDLDYASMGATCSGEMATSHICSTYGLSEGSTYVYVGCMNAWYEDGAANNENLNYVVDRTPSSQSNWTPADKATVSNTSTNVTFNTDENAWCRWSLSDQSYDDMSSDCSGGGTTTHNCSLFDLSTGSEWIYLSCKDAQNNKDDTSSNVEINYNVFAGESLIVDGTTVTLYGSQTFNYIEVKNGGVLYVEQYDTGSEGTGVLNITAIHNITLDETSRIDGDKRGGRGGTGGIGGTASGDGGDGGLNGTNGGVSGTNGGPGGPSQCAGSGGGAGGGGYGGPGENGTDGGGRDTPDGGLNDPGVKGEGGEGGPVRGSESSYSILMGAGGGGGGGGSTVTSGTAGSNGGDGENGGAAIFLKAPLIVVNGTVTANGGNGGVGGSGKSGCYAGGTGKGASGGGILLDGSEIQINGDLTAIGGTGGGGGRIKVFYGVLDNSSSTVDVSSGTIYYQGRPSGDTSNSSGSSKDVFMVDENVSIVGSGFELGSSVNVYVVNDSEWIGGEVIGSDVGDGMDTLVVNSTGGIGPQVIWEVTLPAGYYDVVFDQDQDGIYNHYVDDIDGESYGFEVKTYDTTSPKIFIESPTKTNSVLRKVIFAS